jgi:subtilisin family serine protease
MLSNDSRGRGRSRSALGLSGILLVPLIAAIGAPRNDAPAVFRDGVVLIRFRPSALEERVSAILGSAGASEIKRIGVGVHVLNVGPGRVLGVIQALKAFNDILYAEPDYLHTVDGGSIPNDTFLGNQWAIQNTGQNVNGVTGTAGADERLPAAWSITTGTNAVVVAVLDTGVQYSHPDLATNMWTNPGGIGGCPAGTHGYNVLNATCDPMDDENSYGGHGTHVSGILGAVANNASGVAGVNWTTSIMALKWVTGSDTGYTSDLITAMDWVIHAKQSGVNVRIINDSATWPGTGFSQALSDEIDLAGANDILFVTAAGNTAQNNDIIPRYPCSLDRPNMICVGASDQNDNPWSSSNYGNTTVKLAAPGVNIYSTLRLSNYGYVSGCSMASPQVAGTAALILSLGYASVATLKSMILNNVDTLPSLGSFVATGGRLNVCKAVPGCSSAATGTPVLAAAPVITGIPQYGAILGASPGQWSGAPAQYAYQWYRCANSTCLVIAGATSQSYAALAQADIGSSLVVAVTASNTSGSATGLSSASGVVAAGSSPFAIGSTIQDGATIGGIVQWQATPAPSVNFVQFYVDGLPSSGNTIR